MTLAKIVVTGTVIKNPEKRFTQSNLAVTSLILDIYPQDSTVVRVMAFGALADKTAETITAGNAVIVDGRLQMETVKTSNGREKKVATINASSVEKVTLDAAVPISTGGYTAQPSTVKSEPVVQFSTEEIAEDLIDPDEIPF